MDPDVDADAGPEPGAAPEPPTPQRVAERALVVAAVVSRALLEAGAGGESARARLLRWLGDLGIDPELEPEEAAMLAAPVGGLDEEQAIAGSWQSEGLAVLGWALGACDIPPHDRQCVDPAAVADAVGFLDSQPHVLIRPELRSPAELAWCGNLLLALHWRVRDYQLRPQAMDFRAFGRDCWFGPIDLSALPLVDDDLSIDGVAIHAASSAAVSRVQSIAYERHRAINWLLGSNHSWSETDTST